MGIFFLDAVETTRLTKSFKAYLYQAFVELGGVYSPLKVEILAAYSRELLEHRPDRLVAELPDAVRRVKGNSHAWINYWRKNPIHFSCKQDKRSPQAWFMEEKGFFGLNFTVSESLKSLFEAYFTELIEFRLAEYFAKRDIIEAKRTN